MRIGLVFAAAAALVGACKDDKPPHYYVLCEEKDGAGWRLIDYRKDANGYLMSCTYQSPDLKQVSTRTCTQTGCD